MTVSDDHNGSISGMTIAITGGTRGLGLALAHGLVAAGARVALIGRDAAGGQAAAAAVGGNARAYAADVTDMAALTAAFATIAADMGVPGALVCAAGVSSGKAPIWENGEAAYRHCFDINVLGVINALGAALPGMVARGSGQVVVIGGTYGHKGVAGQGIYAASKWAVRGLVRSAALDAAPHGIRVNMVSPGGIDGERLRRLFRESAARSGEEPDAPYNRFVASTALGRLVSEEDVARAVLHLLGPGGRMMTGQDIVVDSGTII
ncbi:SDR family oxidoreductase [Novosphingobium flavum]|uniref:SDR family oxidoreductase n=1 Tax=Novosphingobium flavum TaxID=1778672 RepID=A0A7X1FQP0_9SPHN|nr:SDR family oxidoreductase [Novosphingobium flavum]MBC2665191.1 SDR family oxidoreductase [Novosphingobium flavum]